MNFMNWKNRHTPLLLLLITLVATALTGCSTSKFVPEDRYLLDAVQVRTDSKDLDAAQFGQYVRQKGNSHWFSLFKIPLGTYSLAGRDSTKWLNRTLRHIGEEPVVYDSLEAARSCADLRLAMQNMGYMNSYVDFETQVRGRKLKAIYTLHPGDPYRISSFRYDIPDSAVAQVLAPVFGTGDQQVGEVFTVSSLDNLRKRIATVLNDSGFYRFHKDFVTYTADSLQGTQGVNLVCRILPYRENSSAPPKPHPRYRVRSIHYRSGDGYDLPLRRSVLAENTVVKAGEWFSASDLQRTYNNFARLGAVRYTNITFREDTLHNLDTDIRLSMRKPNTIAFQPEGTNTAGDFGAAATLTYQNRNLFRGSELLSIELRGAFEAIKGLEGYERGDYEEYGVEARFQMPRLMAPFLSRKGRRGSTASTELSVAWNLQNRPEFHRRVFSAGLKYRWPTRDGRVQYKLDVLDLSYVYMPWISATFKHDYLDSVSNRNAILRYNYEDLFIMKAGFGLTYNAGDRVIRASVETAGNLLSGSPRSSASSRTATASASSSISPTPSMPSSTSNTRACCVSAPTTRWPSTASWVWRGPMATAPCCPSRSATSPVVPTPCAAGASANSVPASIVAATAASTSSIRPATCASTSTSSIAPACSGSSTAPPLSMRATSGRSDPILSSPAASFSSTPSSSRSPSPTASACASTSAISSSASTVP